MLDLNHSPASYLTPKYHSVDTRDLLDAFTNVGFNMATQGCQYWYW